MSTPVQPVTAAAPPAKWLVVVRIAIVVILVTAVAAVGRWCHSPAGREFLHQQHLLELGGQLHDWAQRNPLTAGSAFVGLYVLLAVLALPLWWLQIVGGLGFGLCGGFLLSTVASVIGAVGAQLLSRTLIGQWFQSRIIQRKAAIEKLDHQLGHNGLLVVMALRLMHLTPFGLSNYLFGITRIRVRDVIIGTLIGNIPTLLFYAGIGSGHHDWRYWGLLVGLDLMLMVPVAIKWFGNVKRET